MRAHDIIRSVLDLIDNIEGKEEPAMVAITPEPEHQDEETRRLQQIVDFLSQSYQIYDNSPAEVIAGIDSVTKDAGGGWNGPKHPSDIRADSVAMYPHHIHKPGA